MRTLKYLRYETALDHLRAGHSKPMLNRYPLWKYIIILSVLALAFIYAAPNLYPNDPAIQISGIHNPISSGDSVVNKVKQTLKHAKINTKNIDLNNGSLLIRLLANDDQLTARALIKETLGDNYVVALNLAPTTPHWLSSLGAAPLKLGLDLSGGVHFLMEVDTNQVVKNTLDAYTSEIKLALRKEKLRYRTLPASSLHARLLGFKTESARNSAKKLIIKEHHTLKIESDIRGDYFVLRYLMTEEKIHELEDYAVQQNVLTIRNRVNELGVSEPLVQRQGRQHVVVELPGVQDTAEAKRILGKTANLEFRLEAPLDASSFKVDTFPMRSNPQQRAGLNKDIILSGDSVSNAQANFDTQSSSPQVNISLDSRGGHLMNRATRNNLGRRMAVLFIEQRPVTHYETKLINSETVKETITTFKEERSIISLATIQSALGNSFRITGLESSREASELALLLRAGSLAAPMHFVEERTVGPSLGKENIRMGITSTVVGFGLVLLFMFIVYKAFGLIANIALALNLVLLLALMSLISATLTMPGIAGIVLTLGMAVDANVLIFSRIREELKKGVQPQQAIFEGYNRAFISIFDANITTLLVGIILYAVGTGSVKGFAVTLSLGIITSMFTAVMVSRSIVNMVYGARANLKKISI